MAYDNLLFQVSDKIARITFDRPNVLNALNRKTMDELGDCLKKVRADDDIRVLILTGAGEKAFVAGADINELSQQTPVNGREFTLYGQEIFHRLETLGKPVIAAINGFALGGGCELALACTLRVAARNAKLGQPEVKLGIIPGYGGTQRIGLVNRVVEPGELLATAEAIAKKIIANAPLAVKYALEAVERGMEMPQEEGLYLEATLFGLCCATQDMRDGTRAFLEKRSPKFEGR
jgi:enoyl-CoA hydratase